MDEFERKRVCVNRAADGSLRWNIAGVGESRGPGQVFLHHNCDNPDGYFVSMRTFRNRTHADTGGDHLWVRMTPEDARSLAAALMFMAAHVEEEARENV